jgi:hypothetical protein
MLPVMLWILHAEPEDLRWIPEITRLDIFDGASTDFHDDGLFSTRIFGLVGSKERDELYGKINLKVRVLHPKIYRELCALKELYREILDGKRTAKFIKEAGDFVASIDADASTGYSFFMQHLDQLVLRRGTSPARNGRIDFIEKWRHRMTLKQFIVMPAGLRDVEAGEDGRVTKHEINDYYYRILASASTITESGDMNSPAYDAVRRSIQLNVNEVYAYIEGIIGGKDGFFKDKVMSRRVREGTRNVLTSMNTSGQNLESPNVPSFDSTVLGVYQAASSLAPLVIHWLRVGVLEKIVAGLEGDIPLLDKQTLSTKWVTLPPYERDRWTTENGLRDLINSLVDVEARHRPIEIMGHYLALVYLGEGTFRIFHDIMELPPELDRKQVHPITLMELIYLSGYSKWAKHFTTITRYPIAGDDSTYPSRLYVRSTTIGEVRRELDSTWTPMEGDDFLAVEYPKPGLTTYHDSESPHPSRLAGLGADFDGDTGSATTLMLKDSLVEIENYLGTRNAWVKPDGRVRASVSYDTSDLVVRNLTGRFDHVAKPVAGEFDDLMAFMNNVKLP